MTEEHKSRYELFLEDEARKAQPTKRCSKCGEVKALGEFHQGNWRCKLCRSVMRSKFKSDRQRFWARVTKQTEAPYCWHWGSTDGSHTTKCYWKGKHRNPQHIAYEMTTGEMPEGGHIRTSCRNHCCVNPAHTKAVTHEEYLTWFYNHNSDKLMGSKRPGTGAKGEANHNTRLTEEQVMYIRTQAAEGRSHADIARELGYSNPGIGLIVNRVNWGHIAGTPEPKEDHSHFICPHCNRTFHATKTVAHTEKCLDQIERVRVIRALLSEGLSKTTVASKVGVTRQRITQTLRELAHVS